MSPLAHRLFTVIYWGIWILLVIALLWFHDRMAWWVAFAIGALLAGAAPEFRNIRQLFMSDEDLRREMKAEHVRLSAFFKSRSRQ